jgi:hypothetical protein
VASRPINVQLSISFNLCLMYSISFYLSTPVIQSTIVPWSKSFE